jgi:ABC-type multidrug transport system fused ATPase/permease subunit
MLIAEFTFGEALLTVLGIFLFAAWLMVLFTILGDLFRDHELSGWWKAVWVLFLIFIPFLTALIYLIARGSGMRERALKEQAEARKALAEYAAETGAGGTSADELTKLSALHDQGKLSDEEFQRAKQRIVG